MRPNPHCNTKKNPPKLQFLVPGILSKWMCRTWFGLNSGVARRRVYLTKYSTLRQQCSCSLCVIFTPLETHLYLSNNSSGAAGPPGKRVDLVSLCGSAKRKSFNWVTVNGNFFFSWRIEVTIKKPGVSRFSVSNASLNYEHRTSFIVQTVKAKWFHHLKYPFENTATSGLPHPKPQSYDWTLSIR